MANQQKPNQQGQQNEQRAVPDQNGEVSRSEDLLPAGAADNTADNTADGRFEVAEEVNMDQQSDATRRVGKAPKGIAADALAESLKPGAPKDSA
jgi:hypothetical protein